MMRSFLIRDILSDAQAAAAAANNMANANVAFAVAAAAAAAAAAARAQHQQGHNHNQNQSQHQNQNQDLDSSVVSTKLEPTATSKATTNGTTTNLTSSTNTTTTSTTTTTTTNNNNNNHHNHNHFMRHQLIGQHQQLQEAPLLVQSHQQQHQQLLQQQHQHQQQNQHQHQHQQRPTQSAGTSEHSQSGATQQVPPNFNHLNSPLDALFQMTSSTFDALKRGEKRKEHTVSATTKQSPKKKRKSRTAFTNNQIYELERRFHAQKYLSPTDRDEIAMSLNLTNAQVITWFQNRRAKMKRDLEEQRRDLETTSLLSIRSFFLESLQGSLQALSQKKIAAIEQMACESSPGLKFESCDDNEINVDVETTSDSE